jgi:hypothetical protein
MQVPMELDSAPKEQKNPNEDQALGEAFVKIKLILDQLSNRNRFSALRAVASQYGMNISFQSQLAQPLRGQAAPKRKNSASLRGPAKQDPPKTIKGQRIAAIKRDIKVLNTTITEIARDYPGKVLPAEHEILVRRQELFRLLQETKASSGDSIPAEP